eukprot:gene21119-28990_t
MPFNNVHVAEVLVQGAYMSGDRNSIATALRLKPKLGVLVIYCPTLSTQGLELENFYKSIVGADRAKSLEITDPSDIRPGADEELMKSVYRL